MKTVCGMGAFQESHPENRSFKHVHLRNYQLTTLSRPEVVVRGAHCQSGTQITLHQLHTLSNALKCVSEPRAREGERVTERVLTFSYSKLYVVKCT